MAGSVNKVTILGNLGADPEVRYTQQSVKVVTLSLATSEQWKDRSSGEKKEKTEWHRVTIWGSLDNDGLAGIAEKYLRKGSKVYLTGQLETRKWKDQQGNDRYTTEIVLRGFKAELVLVDRQEGSGRPPHPADQGSGDNTTQQSSKRPQSAMADDDIPF